MNRRLVQVAALAISLACASAHAQPVDLAVPPATTLEFPAGITVAKAKGPNGGMVYVDAAGHVLYGMDMRSGIVRYSPDAAQYCKGACTEMWEPLLAPADAKPNVRFPALFAREENSEGFYAPAKAPDWTIIAGPNGPQWVYKGWNMVYTRKGERPGTATADGADGMIWNTLKFVPPVPKVDGPSGVGTVFVDGAYVLADKDGRLLFTGKCTKDCAGWVPLSGGMASAGLGEWQVGNEGDRPQWYYRGKPVYVSQEGGTRVPGKGVELRP